MAEDTKTTQKGKKWLPEEKIMLNTELSQNLSRDVISKNHKRSVNAIIAQMQNICYSMHKEGKSIEEIIEKSRLTNEEIANTIQKFTSKKKENVTDNNVVNVLKVKDNNLNNNILNNNILNNNNLQDNNLNNNILNNNYNIEQVKEQFKEQNRLNNNNYLDNNDLKYDIEQLKEELRILNRKMEQMMDTVQQIKNKQENCSNDEY